MDVDIKTQQPKERSIFHKMVEGQRAISMCIRTGGDIGKLAKERDIMLVKPIKMLKFSK